MVLCQNCGRESHCGNVIKDEQCLGEQMELICAECRCEVCVEVKE